jgi:hypothetical protein
MTSKKSKVWNYFKEMPSSSKVAQAKCSICFKCLSNKDGSTTAMSKHLITQHDIDLKRQSETSDEVFVKKQRTMLEFGVRANFEETVAKLASVDGITIRAITKSEFIRESIYNKFGKSLPKNESDVMQLILMDYMKKSSEIINKIEMKVKNNKRFSLSLDEWTSVAMKRYVNINLHACEEEHPINLGLVRIHGSCTAVTMVQLVTEHLAKFSIDFEKHIVGSTGDGAAVMIKFGKECPSIYQMCFNHGIHLAVCDTLYKVKTNPKEKDMESENNNDCEEDNFTDTDSDLHMFSNNDSENYEDKFLVHNSIKSVRKIVKFFRLSPVRNTILQKEVKAGIGHEVNLKLDVQTRWNSMVDMISQFLRLREYITSALKELNSLNLLNDVDFSLLEDLKNALIPVKLSVEAISRTDATLHSADLAINFMMMKLKDLNSKISLELLNNLKIRIGERTNPEVKNLLKFLKNGKEKISKQSINFAIKLMKRLFSLDWVDANSSIDTDTEIEEFSTQHEEVDMAKQLENILQSAKKSPQQSRNDFQCISKEFDLFKLTGKKTKSLQQLNDVLCTIKPTSTDAERSFSVAGCFCSKLRSRLSDKSLNALVFLKYYYLRK